jgi:hypothetical protein
VKRLFALAWLSALLGVLVPGCVYDSSDRCGPHQKDFKDDRCTCEDGYVPGDEGCVPCGDNERDSNGECVCVDGYARPSDGEACRLIPKDLGAECDADSAPCADEDYPLCHSVSGSAGYCTNACTSDDDCTGGYKCHLDGADGFCRRPPLGFGDSCKSDDDCAEGEATFCEKIQSHLCIVPCSAGHTDGCFEGDVCCDYQLFEPVCVPEARCTSMSGTVVP